MNKTVIITGSSRGIGRATAELFARNNYNVVINYLHSETSATELLHSLTSKGCKVIAVKADVADLTQVKRLFDECDKSFGGVDVLVNNAGISQQKLFTDITDRDWDNMMNTNVKGVFNCCKAAIGQMLRNEKGRIINISSIWGITGGSCEVHYSAAKAAVIGLTKALAKELGPSGICVNCVAPGVIETDMNNSLSAQDINMLKEATPLERMGTPIEIAETILFLASDKSGFITGQVISPNGGMVI